MTKSQKAYSLWIEAERLFEDALRAAYGSNYGDMRYRTKQQTPEVRAAGDAFERAANAWVKAKDEEHLATQVKTD